MSAVLLAFHTIGSKFVAEHVNELQSVKSFAQSLIDGVLPGGGTLSLGKVTFTGLFDSGGKFQQTWSALGAAVTPAVGTTPESTIYSVLGTTSDTHNLLVLEAKINSLKAIIWAGAKNIIGQVNYNSMSHLERVKAFDTIQNVFDYLNLPDAQSALQYSYDGMLDGWQLFQDTIKSSVDYNFVSAYKEWNTAHFENMITVTKAFLDTKLREEIVYWGSSGAALQYGRAQAQAQLTILQTQLADLGNNIVISTGFIR